MKKFQKRKNQGITLVALVITIVILVILAGISISALTNQGLFKQAQNAKDLTEQKTAEENAILANYLEQIEALTGGTSGGSENPTLASQVSVGDYVAYDATSNYSYTPPKGSGSSSGAGGTEGETIGTPNITLESQMFTSNSSIRWRVLSTDTSTGEVVLISEEPIKTDAGNDFHLHGAIGYLYAEQELNNICSIYGHGTGANTSKSFEYQTGDTVEGLTTGTITGSGARSINVDDINAITGYTPSATTTPYTKSIYYPTTSQDTGYSTSVASRTDVNTYYTYTASTYLTDTTSEMYKMLFRDTEDTKNIYYWLASRSVSSNSVMGEFNLRSVWGGQVNKGDLFYSSSNAPNKYQRGYGVRPIVYLKSTVQTSGKDASGAWTIIDK